MFASQTSNLNKNTFNILFENQMKITQAFNIANHYTKQVNIQVPFSIPQTQWHLFNLHELDTSFKPTKFSYYDGYQLYKDIPYNQVFNNKWVDGPIYDNITIKDNDESFTYNCVFSSQHKNKYNNNK
jgi:hypothetical protein